MDRVELQSRIEEVCAEWGVPGLAVTVVRRGEVWLQAGVGVRRLPNGDPVTEATQFAIASTTKAMTTTLLAMLVDEGRLRWDDPVRRHLPWFQLADPYAAANVAVRDLVCHRTGLSRNDMLWYRSDWGRAEIVQRAGRVDLAAGFREKYQYNNIMYMAAGLVIEAITGQSWEQVIRERLFEPLGMRTANCSAVDAELSANHATPHRRSADGRIDPIAWLNLDAEGPGGSVNAPVCELSAWIRFQLGKGEFEGRRLVSWSSLGETHTPQVTVRPEEDDREVLAAMQSTQQSYGMGWSITDYRGHRFHSHGGAIDGFRSNVALLPDAESGVAVLVNCGPTNAHMAVRNLVLDALLGLEPRPWSDLYCRSLDLALARVAREKDERAAARIDAPATHPLEAFTGEFTHPGYGAATLAVEQGTLVLRWSTLVFQLEHWHYNTFAGKDDETEARLTFALEPDGRPDSFKLFGAEFRRVPSPP